MKATETEALVPLMALRKAIGAQSANVRLAAHLCGVAGVKYGSTLIYSASEARAIRGWFRQHDPEGLFHDATCHTNEGGEP